MSTADASVADPRLGWWPKLALWVLVIVFGVLYLGSIKRNDVAPDGGGAVPPVPAVSPAPAGASTAARPVQPPVDADLEQLSDAATVSGTDAPVHAVESAAFADSLMQIEEGAAGAGADDSDPAPVQSVPVAVDSTPATQIPSQRSPGRARETEQAWVPPVPAPAALAPLAAPTPPVPAAAAPAVPPSRSDASSGGPAALVQASGEGTDLDAQRQRVLAEYEVMLRAARQRMPQYRGATAVPGAAGNPYGYPGFGYGPGGYLPR